MNKRITFIIVFILFIFVVHGQKFPGNSLWYRQPATEWNEALPVGNGRIGGMDFGGILAQRIQFNEESLWAGVRVNSNNPQALTHLNNIRQLIFEGKNDVAMDEAQKYLLGVPPRTRSYQTFGDIMIRHQVDTGGLTNYTRSLHLNSAIASSSFNVGEVQYKREIFTSVFDNIMVIRLSSREGKHVNASITMNRGKDADVRVDTNGFLVMDGQVMDEYSSHHGPVGPHMSFSSIMKIHEHDGYSYSNGDSLVVEGASYITLIMAANTDYNLDSLNFDTTIVPREQCLEDLKKVEGFSYDQLRSRHEAIHKYHFERMDIFLGGTDFSELSTDERLKRAQVGYRDNGLVALYFQYGRYLLLASSGFFAKLPANLQGIWNPHFDAPWNSDFHTNINIQMNYWPAELCNLPGTIDPYVNFFNKIREPGRITANSMYGAKGWTMHHVTDPFGYTAVNAHVQWGMFPMAASWVCFPVWRHYEFFKDKTYLKEKAWPMIREAVRFVLDFLVESPEGYLVTNPSYSPENSFIHKNDTLRLSYAPTMDIMIIKEIFKYAKEAIEDLDVDHSLADSIDAVLGKLPPIQVGADGTIQEWIEDYKELEPWHRHISHLLGLHPGTQITEKDTLLFEAARETIEKRLRYGGGHTGWSRAWIINFYARLLDGDEAYYHIQKLFQKSTLTNLFDDHPPFQIDGNFGGTAGIAEMLLQSHKGYIDVLPALPNTIREGSIKGIRARGGFELYFSWKEGKLEQIEILSTVGDSCKIKYNDNYIEFDTDPGRVYNLTNSLITGVNSKMIKQPAELKVFPNPVNDDYFNVIFKQGDGREAIELSIYDVYGRKIYREDYSGGNIHDQIETTGLKEHGEILFIRVTGNNISLSKKLILVP